MNIKTSKSIKCKFQWIIIAIGVFSVFSCDDKIQELEDLNSAPTFQYFNRGAVSWQFIDNGIIIDSAKIHTDVNNMIYPIVLKINDVNSNTSYINISSSDSEDRFYIDDVSYYNNTLVNNDSISIGFLNSSVGIEEFTITARDYFDLENHLKFKIHFKENRSPKPILNVFLSNEIAPNDYQLNASNSFDSDRNLGGFIVLYEFIIDNEIISTSESIINHVFSSGSHTIKLRVKDNDNSWSNYVTYNLVI